MCSLLQPLESRESIPECKEKEIATKNRKGPADLTASGDAPLAWLTAVTIGNRAEIL